MELRLGDFGLAAKLETVEQRKKLAFLFNFYFTTFFIYKMAIIYLDEWEQYPYFVLLKDGPLYINVISTEYYNVDYVLNLHNAYKPKTITSVTKHIFPPTAAFRMHLTQPVSKWQLTVALRA